MNEYDAGNVMQKIEVICLLENVYPRNCESRLIELRRMSILQAFVFQETTSFLDL